MQILNLHNFSSFFELFAALCLGYVVSKDEFRYGLNDSIFKFTKYKNKVNDKVNYIKASKTIMASGTFNPIFDNYSELFLFKLNLIEEKKEKDALKFIKDFQSMFLLSGLFCIYILLMEGFNQFYENKNLLVIPECLLFSNLLIIVNLFIFIRSFIKKYKKDISHKLIVLILFISIILSIVLFKKKIINELNYSAFINGYFNISTTIFIVISPFILHSIRAFFHEYLYEVRFFLFVKYSTNKLDETKNKIELSEFIKNNLLDFENEDKVWDINHSYRKFYKKLINIYSKIDPYFKTLINNGKRI